MHVRVSYRIFWLGGGEHLGDLSHIGGHQACLTEIITSEIQKVSPTLVLTY